MEDQTFRKDFGIGLAGPKAFYDDRSQLNGSRHAHVLRAAFDLLDLDGIFCADDKPLVYFKKVRRINIKQIAQLHRKFWNHGGSPILVVVSNREVHVYSGFVRPEPNFSVNERAVGLVEVLDRASEALKEFLPAVESGEYFRLNKNLFDPENRVDRHLLNNLEATRDKLARTIERGLEPKILDALLCRLVFACYLFDRGIVGANYLKNIAPRGSSHLRDILAMPSRTEAKDKLYLLFRKLGKDFNGDLFSDDLDTESHLVKAAHIEPLDDFFRGTDTISGQGSFWPYDFAAIPVEAISSIYERFLHSARHEGAYYTPRVLAELVLDMVLDDQGELLGKRYLDPSCGSGIFLVALFNRMAEEWKRKNPRARNNRRARELRKLLCSSLHGVDINPTACRITAFSLYLAYLDQLSPRDVRELRDKGHRLPRLVRYSDSSGNPKVEGNIFCGDFFAEDAEYATDVDLVVGNPPWGSLAAKDSPASVWCRRNSCPIPDIQISAAFVWKAARHVSGTGRVSMVLPYGTLFNHGETALEFQRTLLERHSVDRVLNLADYQFFLFAEARHPALVITYRAIPPQGSEHRIEYWVPKTDWLVTRAELISITPEDRSELRLGEIIEDLRGKDAPQIWKQWFWGTGRDRRLIDRLSLYPRLRDQVRQSRENKSTKRWLIAEGWQPVGENDDPDRAKELLLPSNKFIEATSRELDLFLLPEDCAELTDSKVLVRDRSNKNTDIYRSPHVLVSQGFRRIAYANFDVSFRHALRGITGPKEDRELLMFLSAYLRSSVARYFLFHTSSNWGISRQKIHVEELLRLPLPLPKAMPDPVRAQSVVTEVANLIAELASQANDLFVDRKGIVVKATNTIDELLYDYFDIQSSERVLIEDTLRISVPSVRPTRKRLVVPTIEPSSPDQRQVYLSRLLDTLNDWSVHGSYVVKGYAIASPKLGIGVAVLQKAVKSQPDMEIQEDFGDLLEVLHRVSEAASRRVGTFELIRGSKVFDRDRLYIVKPIARRYWTQTAALNDSDEISGTILMHSGAAAL